jgi:hypothetical protein
MEAQNGSGRAVRRDRVVNAISASMQAVSRSSVGFCFAIGRRAAIETTPIPELSTSGRLYGSENALHLCGLYKLACNLIF